MSENSTVKIEVTTAAEYKYQCKKCSGYFNYPVVRVVRFSTSTFGDAECCPLCGEPLGEYHENCNAE